MAWLETKGDVFRIRFRFGGAKHLLPLHTSDKREAADALARFKGNLRLVEQGIINSPPDDADIGIYIISGGKLKGHPSQILSAERITLAKLFDSYLTSFPRGAKEVRTWQTETTHIGHLRRLLDINQLLSEITSKTLQAYIDARTLERGKAKKTIRRETVHKEIGTFSSVWNKWGIQQGLTDRPAPVKNLTYPKGTNKPPFQIREQIERKIRLGKLSVEAKAELWQSLFLTIPEVESLLDHIRDLQTSPFVYPMFAIAQRFPVKTTIISTEIVLQLLCDKAFAAI